VREPTGSLARCQPFLFLFLSSEFYAISFSCINSYAWIFLINFKSLGGKDLTLDTTSILIIGLFVLLIAVLYFEFKYMRPKRRDDIEAVLTKDQAYNALVSAKAVSKSLKDMGKDTKEAEVLLERAQLNYEQKDYVKSISMAKASKDALLNAKDIPLAKKELEAPAPSQPSQEEEVVHEDRTVHEIKKLPQNYMESKFLLSTTQSEIEGAEGKRSVEEAKKLLADAQSSFDSADYTACLSNCMKAKRSLACAPTERSAAMENAATNVSNAKVVPSPLHDLNERSPGTCSKCGEPLLEGDRFCGKCGTEVAQEIKCSRCGAVQGKEDTFCRKCGLKLV
jgi:hypothetical protein